MSAVRSPRRLLQGIGAVFCGMLAVVIPSVLTDAMLHAVGAFPPVDQPQGDGNLAIVKRLRAMGVDGVFTEFPERAASECNIYSSLADVTSSTDRK